MKSYEIAIPDQDDLIIRGKIYMPDDLKQNLSCVIISHGFYSNMKDQVELAEGLANNNIVSIIYDFKGGSPDSESDGLVEEMSVLTEVNDLKDVISFVKRFKEIKSLFLLGRSQGGFVSAIVATEETDIAGLILIYPALVIPDDARKLYGTKENIPENPKARDLPVGKQYFEDVIEMDALKEIEGYEGPVLIIHGTEDDIAPISYSEKASEQYKHSILLKYEGQGHGFDEAHTQEMIEDVVDFVKENALHEA